MYRVMLDIKSQFPFFTNHPDVVYLDSAATTQKPSIVIDALTDFYTNDNANAGRSSYSLASKLATQIEHIRADVQRFIGAYDAQEILFTAGATDSLNKVAYSLGMNYLQDNDEILYCPYDHKSFVLPWLNVQKLLKDKGIHIRMVPFEMTKMGSIDREDLFSKITAKTKVINATHVHNIYGADSDIDQIKKHIGDKDIIINVDASQSVGHIPVNVQELGADTLSFSGHKMFAGQGIGVLYINQRLQQFIPPVFVGGGNGTTLKGDDIEINNFTQAYEAGTQNYAGIITLGKAIEFIEKVGIEKIHTHLAELTQYLLNQLRQIKGIEFAYGPYYWSCSDGMGIVSFKIDKISPEELGFILAEKGILVRTGDHCISTHDEFNDTIRVSMHIYNTKEDIDKLQDVLEKIVG